MYPETPIGQGSQFEFGPGGKVSKLESIDATQSSLWNEGITVKGNALKPHEILDEHASYELERNLMQNLTQEEYNKYMTEGTEFMNDDEVNKILDIFKNVDDKHDLLNVKSYGMERTGMVIPEDIQRIWKDKGVRFGMTQGVSLGEESSQYLTGGSYHRRAFLSVGEGGKYHGKYINAYNANDKEKMKEVLRLAYEDVLNEGNFSKKNVLTGEISQEDWGFHIDDYTEQGTLMMEGFVPEDFTNFIKNAKFDWNDDDSMGGNIDAWTTKKEGGQGYSDYINMHEKYFLDSETGEPGRIFGEQVSPGIDTEGLTLYDTPQFEGQTSRLIHNGKKYYSHQQPLISDQIDQVETISELGANSTDEAVQLISDMTQEEVVETTSEKVGEYSAELLRDYTEEELIEMGVEKGVGKVTEKLAAVAGKAVPVVLGGKQMLEGFEEGRPEEVVHGAVNAASPWLLTAAAASPDPFTKGALVGTVIVNTIWDLLDG